MTYAQAIRIANAAVRIQPFGDRYLVVSPLHDDEPNGATTFSSHSSYSGARLYARAAKARVALALLGVNKYGCEDGEQAVISGYASWREVVLRQAKNAQLKLWSKRTSTARGEHWVLERNVEPHTTYGWLSIYRNDERGIEFVVSATKPRK